MLSNNSPATFLVEGKDFFFCRWTIRVKLQRAFNAFFNGRTRYFIKRLLRSVYKDISEANITKNIIKKLYSEYVF